MNQEQEMIALGIATRGSRVTYRMLAVVIAVMAAFALDGAGALAGGSESRDHLQLTYTVWFAPAMTGVVGGDVVGTFGGSVVSTRIPNSPLVRLRAVYVITANDASQSFTAVVKGKLNTQTLLAVLNGVVTSGSLTGQRVHSEFQVVGTCPEHPRGPCYQGALRVSNGSERD
jgi:hypothetical protein